MPSPSPRVLGGLGKKTPASEARYCIASTRHPGQGDSDDVRRDASSARVAADGGHRGALAVLPRSLSHASRPDRLHGLTLVVFRWFHRRTRPLVRPKSAPSSRAVVQTLSRRRPALSTGRRQLTTCARRRRSWLARAVARYARSRWQRRATNSPSRLRSTQHFVADKSCGVAAVLYRSTGSGSTAAPSIRTSKWRCGPAASPVAPTRPT